MARDWEVSNTLASLKARMAKFGENVAPVPICMTEETRTDGERFWTMWVVDLHIKVRRVTEFDISTEAETLSEALRKAYLGLNNEEALVAHAARANLAFGVTV